MLQIKTIVITKSKNNSYVEQLLLYKLIWLTCVIETCKSKGNDHVTFAKNNDTNISNPNINKKIVNFVIQILFVYSLILILHISRTE